MVMWQKIIPEILSAIGDKKLSMAVSKLKFIFLLTTLYYKSATHVGTLCSFMKIPTPNVFEFLANINIVIIASKIG